MQATRHGRQVNVDEQKLQQLMGTEQFKGTVARDLGGATTVRGDVDLSWAGRREHLMRGPASSCRRITDVPVTVLCEARV